MPGTWCPAKPLPNFPTPTLQVTHMHSLTLTDCFPVQQPRLLSAHLAGYAVIMKAVLHFPLYVHPWLSHHLLHGLSSYHRYKTVNRAASMLAREAASSHTPVMPRWTPTLREHQEAPGRTHARASSLPCGSRNLPQTPGRTYCPYHIVSFQAVEEVCGSGCDEDPLVEQHRTLLAYLLSATTQATLTSYGQPVCKCAISGQVADFSLCAVLEPE